MSQRGKTDIEPQEALDRVWPWCWQLVGFLQGCGQTEWAHQFAELLMELGMDHRSTGKPS